MDIEEVENLITFLTESIIDRITNGKTSEGFEPAVGTNYPQLYNHIGACYRKVCNTLK